MWRIHILVGSVYGTALHTARELEKELVSAQVHVSVYENPTITALGDAHTALVFCTSTTGSGELPPNLLPLYVEMNDQFPMLNGRPVGLITLGDSSYMDSFCGAGDTLEQLLEELGGQQLLPRLNIDACETTEPEIAALSWIREFAAKLK